MAEIKKIRIEKIRPNPKQPRKNFSEKKLKELASSIESAGLIQPILVRPVEEGFELVHGERRLRAHKLLDVETIRAEVREMSDEEALQASLTENLQREDINPISEAESFETMMDEFELTQREVAEKVGKSRSYVANSLRLLDFPPILQEFVLRKTIKPWPARLLYGVWNKYGHRLLDFYVDFDLTTRELKETIQQLDRGDHYVSIVRQMPVELLAKEVDYGEDRYNWEGIDEEERLSHLYHDFIQWALWANKNLEGVHFDIQDDRQIEPVKATYLDHEILFGQVRIAAAKSHGYDGKLETEILFPREMFEIEKTPQEG